MKRLPWSIPVIAAVTMWLSHCPADDLPRQFTVPPHSALPGVYWYFMDGNLSREGMTRDLESMNEAGIGHLIFLEVDVGVVRGPIRFLSERWQELYLHAVREAERLGIEITLGSGPGWAGSGGPWVKPEQSMQHLVASRVQLQGPGPVTSSLPVPPPRRPFFGNVPAPLQTNWAGFFKDVAVLAYPAPSISNSIPDIEEKALYYRAPFSSQPGVKPFLEFRAEYRDTTATGAIPTDQILDLTRRLRPDGTLDWNVPPGSWTVMRFVSRNNGASTRPAPAPGIGFECDKFDAAAFDAHFEQYIGKLLKKVGPRAQDRGWTRLHIDSWEMGAQNWTPHFREEFRRRRGYDPLPYYPAYLGEMVGSREITERFLWDLRLTGSELVVENHAEHLKTLAHRHGFTLSIEPYDMNPSGDFDLGAVADVPMAEFWSLGFNTAFSCQEAASIGHVMGRPVVAAEAFTGAPGENWKMYPGSLKNQGDWAFATGINRLMYHTFAHKPDAGRPGMVMGPYGVHWDRGQTWWPMVRAYHQYIARCQEILQQGRTVADILYLIPEGAPNVFQPPTSALAGSDRMPDRRGFNFDGCSAQALMKLARVSEGRVVFPGGAAYRMLVLPGIPTMTPELLRQLEALVRKGATVVGAPPRKSPSRVNYPACDREVARLAGALWGSVNPPASVTIRPYGKGRIIWGGSLGLPESVVTSNLYPTYAITADLLHQLGATEDFDSPGPLRYTHRRTADREIYFVANRTEQPVQTTATFRVSGRRPELWDPQTGQIRGLPEFRGENGVTRISLRFEAYESYIVVFPNDLAVAVRPTELRGNFPDWDSVGELSGPWEVSFDPGLGGPTLARFERLEDWSQRPEPGIHYYSGVATYRLTFDLPRSQLSNVKSEIMLDLGTVHVMARVRLNGHDCGTVWTAPWRVNLTEEVRPTGNRLEIEVANLWPNRMIGDARFPRQTYSQSTLRPYKAGDALFPSGLLGPVRVMVQR
jgi:hypothetical protein